jgi:bifunctional DNA-binding transcriptional regulator/antitoxin component of YhaV-PrlF toxin-antitoxin module
MATPRSGRGSAVTRLGRKNQETLPQEVCDAVGAQIGDTLNVSVVKRARKVPAGSIVLSPEFFNARAWTDEEWLQKEKEVDVSKAQGKSYGPFESSDEAIAFLKKDSKRRRSQL